MFEKCQQAISIFQHVFLHTGRHNYNNDGWAVKQHCFSFIESTCDCKELRVLALSIIEF